MGTENVMLMPDFVWPVGPSYCIGFWPNMTWT